MRREHAVVLGAGMAGLLAARVLADAYRRVTVVERDRLADNPAVRRGVPQSAHGHTLLPGGGVAFERLFPGLTDELEAAGVPVTGRDEAELHFSPQGYPLRTDGWSDQRLTTPVPSRPRLEWQVRARVSALRNVTIRDGCEVAGLVAEPGRITGVRLADDLLDADLVVDALGRGARTPAWLRELGYPEPAERTLKVDVRYATVPLRLPAGALTEKLILIGATPERHTGVAMFKHEADVWEFTPIGVSGQRLPADIPGLIALVAGFAPPHVAAALRAAEPLGPLVAHRFPASRWRRYDKLHDFPEGLLVFGDAYSSTNPAYGQGMTVAAQQAVALAVCLTDSRPGLARRFFRAAAKPIGTAWRLAAFADRAVMAGPGGSGAMARPFFRAASRDAALSERFMRVFGLVDPPRVLLHPATLAAVLRCGRRPGVPLTEGVRGTALASPHVNH